MAYKKTSENYNTVLNGVVCEFVCDSVDDIAALPECEAGSMAMVVAEGGLAVYMKNASDTWVVI